MIDATTDGPPKLVARASWILQWATSNEKLHIRFFKGWGLGLVLGLFISSILLCYVPCFGYEYSRSSEGVWELELLGTGWRFRFHPPGVYARWVRCWVRRRLRLFFMGSEERTIRDEEAGAGGGDVELRDRSRWRRGRRQQDEEEQTPLPEPTIPEFTGSYMFSAAGPSLPGAQQGHGNPERQQRVRDEFRMERENIQRAVAERRRSEVQQADAAATLAQNEQSAAHTPQQDAATPQQQQLRAASESVQSQQTIASQHHSTSPAQRSDVPSPSSSTTPRQTAPAPAPATPPVLGPYQRYNPLDPTHPINLTNDDIERERLQKERRANAWYRSMWSFLG